MFEVLLYTRKGCCLCEAAKAVLQKHGLQPQQVDVDREPLLHGRYNDCVPVVVIDGKERFRGHVDERLLRRILRSKPSAPSA